MEQYFEITKQSSRYKEYFDYLEADEACRKAVKKFIEENNIHTEHYAVLEEHYGLTIIRKIGKSMAIN